YAVGGLRAERHGALAARQAHHQRIPGPGVARRRSLWGDAERGVLRQMRRREQYFGEHRRRPADRRDWSGAREASRVRDAQDRPVLGRRIAFGVKEERQYG